MHIKWENPTLNQQLKHLELSLSFELLFFLSFILSFLLLEVFCVCVCVCVCVPKSLKVTMRALFLFPAYFMFKL